MSNADGKTSRKPRGVQLDFGFELPAVAEPELRTPLDWYESWLRYRMAGTAKNHLSREAAEPYRYIWSAWCKWLLSQGEGGDWTECVLQAGPAQAAEFLTAQVKPATQRAGSSDISIVTRERYCMVLRDIYAHLERLGLIPYNPMRRLYALAGEDRPDAEVVPEPVYNWLRQKWSASGGSSSAIDLRDRALILLMLELALTPGELAALRLSQITEDLQAGTFWVSVDGGRSAQRRQLRSEGRTASALSAWLQFRAQMLAGGASSPDIEDLVFFTERRRPLSRRVLFHLTSGEIAAACSALNLPLPRHLGPLVLRNTAILCWLRQGMPAVEVCRLAGYQGVVSLEHLKAHLA